MGSGNASAGPELHTVLSTSAAVLAVYSYFTGWIYLYFYLGHFGISLWSVDVPFHFFFIYAYSVGNLAVVGLGAIAVGVILGLLTSYRSVPLLIGLVTLGSLLFPGIYFVAKEVAFRKAEQVRSGTVSPAVQLFLTDGAEKPVDEFFQKVNGNGELQLLFETKDRIYVIHQLIGHENTLPIGHVYSVRREDAALVKIEVQ